MAGTEPAAHGGSKNQMRTYTDRYVDPLNPSCADIYIEDIAHALALQCRYNGHCQGHLSVARHSLWVSAEVELQVPFDFDLQLLGLLHDASEAYLGDMIRPLKHRPEMAFFHEIEARMESVIAATFGLPDPMPQVILDADFTVLKDRELIGHATTDTSWKSDEVAFLARYEYLQSQR